MAVLLIKWINDKFALSRHIKTLETDLSSGYVLGELLQQLGIEGNFQAYEDKQNTNAKLKNFELLDASLQKIDVKLSIEVSRNIMMERRGAVAQVY